MGKKLAIAGHPTRGSEVIEILEMMGGNNRWTASGGLPNLYYFISNECILYSSQIEKDVVIFTLEEFLEKYPYKIGDKAVYIDDNDIVVISEIEWDNIVGDIFYNVKRIDEDDCFLCPPELLKPYKEEINMKDKEDKLFDSIIWHLRNSINNGKQDISGGDCERYFRELVDKVKETNMNETKFGTAKEPLEIKSNAVKLVDGKVVDNLEEGKTMNKKLAIKGHPTRGNEIIEILKMLGGNNIYNLSGDSSNAYYIIEGCQNEILAGEYIFDTEYMHFFTLEEFLKEFPFKVGDKVIDCYGNTLTIKSMSWHDGFETMVYDFKETEDVFCAEDLESMNDADDNTKPSKETITPSPDITANVTDKNNCDIQCPDGYEFYDENGNLIGTKVMMRPKKPKYPDNYEECVRIAKNIHGYDIYIDVPAYAELMESFVKLLICRDAYWKIAGEEMGMGYSWKYDMSKDEFSYAISYQYGCIEKNEIRHKNAILVFPIKELRDAFYENFKELIESCKELL